MRAPVTILPSAKERLPQFAFAAILLVAFASLQPAGAQPQPNHPDVHLRFGCSARQYGSCPPAIVNSSRVKQVCEKSGCEWIFVPGPVPGSRHRFCYPAYRCVPDHLCAGVVCSTSDWCEAGRCVPYKPGQ